MVRIRPAPDFCTQASPVAIMICMTRILPFVLALMIGCAAQNAPKPAAQNAPKPDQLMITRNPDGTFTVQGQPPKDAKAKTLVIPPQVVVPFVTK